MVKEEGGTVTVSLYEDLPAAATAAVETPTSEEKKDEEKPKPSAEMTTNTEQSLKEGKTKPANKKSDS
jgi:hypothetical protein